MNEEKEVRRFRNIERKTIVIPQTELALEQLMKNDDYDEIDKKGKPIEKQDGIGEKQEG